MKKILLSIFLLFTLAYTDSLTPTISSDSEVGKWRSFFGVEGGVGMFDVSLLFLFGYNSGLFDNAYGLRGLSYGAGILGGWQKYTSEKIGMRNTLGLKIFGTSRTKTGSIEEALFSDAKFANETKSLIIEVVPYYAFDGLFDFIKSGENRFGMNLGFAINVFHLSFLKNLAGFGSTCLSARLGFYTQFNHNILELVATVPLIGIGGGKIFTYNSTLTLGYKYLF
ncbi:hypothetical protein [Helicobacter cholecystus]|uniref:hypothetical protein n=1 Tax=Helicobacter cholecystus TaxID=45498 RepID=UPI002739A940|nr:hypothetical protein [Helicobacter cholecystus]